MASGLKISSQDEPSKNGPGSENLELRSHRGLAHQEEKKGEQVSFPALGSTHLQIPTMCEAGAAKSLSVIALMAAARKTRQG